MNTKLCPSCGTEKPLSSFYSKQVKNGLAIQSYCKPCNAQYNKNYIIQNKERTMLSHRNSKERKRAEAKKFITDYKKDKPCTDCGKVYPHWIMQFDHLRDKVKGVSIMANNGQSIDTIKDEIAKCELVCANCHSNRSYGPFFSPKKIEYWKQL